MSKVADDKIVSQSGKIVSQYASISNILIASLILSSFGSSQLMLLVLAVFKLGYFIKSTRLHVKFGSKLK
jgi:hypothetical protein